jgi:hypothetical protein
LTLSANTNANALAILLRLAWSCLDRNAWRMKPDGRQGAASPGRREGHDMAANRRASKATGALVTSLPGSPMICARRLMFGTLFGFMLAAGASISTGHDQWRRAATSACIRLWPLTPSERLGASEVPQTADDDRGAATRQSVPTADSCTQQAAFTSCKPASRSFAFCR